jgi:hypothetical protein
MGEKKTTPVTLDGIEYQYEHMTQEQQLLVNHVTDLNRKIESAQFNIQQLEVGRNAFIEMLKESLETKK